MKQVCLFLMLVVAVAVISCDKDDFDPQEPDVDKFVELLKNDEYYWRARDEMPDFTMKHIERLLHYSTDTSRINRFPSNPVSSKMTDPKILGECLLWVVEGIRLEVKYASHEPHLMNTSTITRLSGKEILTVSDMYRDWYQAYQNDPSAALRRRSILENTPYKWN